jgi:2-polyprenyl-3-methyl-5-hydroxy-6-metoxy-1,4-benzoquinol methylase
MNQLTIVDHKEHRQLFRSLIQAYDSRLVRAYLVARFVIININILHILQLCMRGKTRVLEIGCGFGLFGCYFAARNPGLTYHGIDLNAKRISMAQTAAQRLGLDNARFMVGDACKTLELEDEYDVIVMMDLMHHIPDTGKRDLIAQTLPRLHPQGRLIIKEIAPEPSWKLAFTWALDVVMTKGFDMWYWRPEQFRELVDSSFHLETYPITDWLPYPHIVYLFSRDHLEVPHAADKSQAPSPGREPR